MSFSVMRSLLLFLDVDLRKGRNAHKAVKLNEMLTNVDVVVIMDIKKYIPQNSNYYVELEEWKNRRILNLNG
jgi:hypothetical protein